MRGVDESGSNFTARSWTSRASSSFRSTPGAESGRLNYVVANDDGIGHGMVRLGIEPEFERSRSRSVAPRPLPRTGCSR